MKKFLLLERNRVMRKQLEKILFSLDERIAVFSRYNVKESFKCAAKMQIDLFIIDVTVDKNTVRIPPELKFVDRLRRTERYFSTPILFITPIEGTLLYKYDKLNCYKFIDKPIDEEEFKTIVERSLIYLEGRQRENAFYFQWDDKYQKVDKDSVTYIQMIDDNLYVHTNDDKIRCVPFTTIRTMMKKLNSSDFVVCHRSTIVNMNYVERMDVEKQVLELNCGPDKVIVGRTYVQYMKEILREK